MKQHVTHLVNIYKKVTRPVKLSMTCCLSVVCLHVVALLEFQKKKNANAQVCLSWGGKGSLFDWAVQSLDIKLVEM